MLQLERNLFKLLSPSTGFLHGVRLAESSFGNFFFANAWVWRPGEREGILSHDLPPFPVSGHALSPEMALRILTMEAVERHSSVFVGSERLRHAKAYELTRFELPSLFHHSDEQRQARSEITPLDDPWWIPEPVQDSTQICWQETRSLLTQETCFVPAGFVYLGYGDEDEPLYNLADSTGCAAGSTCEEATVSALLEVIERDALGIWWYNRINQPALDFADDVFLASIDRSLRGIGRSLALIDITNDLEVPVVAAYSSDQSGRRIYLGCAADVCFRSAAVRAASEMLQFWFWGSVSRDPPSRVAWLERESLNTQPWLKPTSSAQLPQKIDEKSAEEKLKQLLIQLASKGYDPLVVDLTRRWIGIPVVRVLVPGLRSHQPRFGPGRLFDAPYELGWLSRKRQEDELLSYACPI